MNFRKLFIGMSIPAMALIMQSCSSEPERLADAVVDAWEETEEGIEDYSDNLCDEISDDPEALYNSDCEAIYNPFSSNFTLTIPFSRKGYAAVGLIFGSEAADFLSSLESAGRESRSKADIKKIIGKHYNDTWAELMLALVALDGGLTIDVETDSWGDKSFDFSGKELYNMLSERNIFSGSFGDEIPES